MIICERVIMMFSEIFKGKFFLKEFMTVWEFLNSIWNCDLRFN